jgi:hypothetical protein
MSTCAILWRYTWAMPCSVIGCAAALPALLCGARLRWRRGVIEVSGPVVRRSPWSRLPFAAITFGHVVIASNPRDMRRLRAHEQAHVRQCERWGIVFIPAYLLAGAWQWLHGRSAYWHNPFEVQARQQAGR